ncbi:protein phosphatase 2C 50-like [Nymphaea colorata]|nr:protein phosphatase 2C 50-like [Nymphaea colorata]
MEDVSASAIVAVPSFRIGSSCVCENSLHMDVGHFKIATDAPATGFVSESTTAALQPMASSDEIASCGFRSDLDREEVVGCSAKSLETKFAEACSGIGASEGEDDGTTTRPESLDEVKQLSVSSVPFSNVAEEDDSLAAQSDQVAEDSCSLSVLSDSGSVCGGGGEESADDTSPRLNDLEAIPKDAGALSEVFDNHDIARSPLDSRPNISNVEDALTDRTTLTDIPAVPIHRASSDLTGSVLGGKRRFSPDMDCQPPWGCVSICGRRPEMEDALAAVPRFTKLPATFLCDSHLTGAQPQNPESSALHFFGVYDGHGGCQVANYCRDRIHEALVEELRSFDDVGPDENSWKKCWEKILTSCFLKVDAEVAGTTVNEEPLPPDSGKEPIAPETVGSTAVVAILSFNQIIVANCGDSRAVLCRGKEAIPLSVDHKPNREDEYSRIEAAGGKVIQWNGYRVFGVLAMSRSIGDRYLKPWIIPEPEVTFVSRMKEDECLVLASDGLWDVIPNEEACDIARRRILHWYKKNGLTSSIERSQGIDLAAQSAAEHLSKLALQRGTKDNVTVIVIDLKERRKFRIKT